jgi:hypothetical protein
MHRYQGQTRTEAEPETQTPETTPNTPGNSTHPPN